MNLVKLVIKYIGGPSPATVPLAAAPVLKRLRKALPSGNPRAALFVPPERRSGFHLVRPLRSMLLL